MASLKGSWILTTRQENELRMLEGGKTTSFVLRIEFKECVECTVSSPSAFLGVYVCGFARTPKPHKYTPTSLVCPYNLCNERSEADADVMIACDIWIHSTDLLRSRAD